MANSDATRGPLPSTQPAEHRTLLADLESRQDELLRLLSDLEERTKQALAQLSPTTIGLPNSVSAPPTASIATASSEAPVRHEKRAA